MAASTPQSEGDVSRASVVIIPTVVTTMIALVLTLLRLYVRRYMIRMFGWDDFFNVLAMVGLIQHSNRLQICDLTCLRRLGSSSGGHVPGPGVQVLRPGSAFRHIEPNARSV